MKKLLLFLFLFSTVLPGQITVDTSQGAINIYDSEGDGPAIMLIHGNSASGRFFKKQFKAFGEKYRLLAPDLPGHGKSSAAQDVATYSFPGYAKVLAEVVNKLELKKVTLVGWSLGGHIALEMLSRLKNINGVVVTGTPPIELSSEGIMKGFKPFEGLGLLGHGEQFTPEEASKFMGLGGFDIASDDTAFMIKDAMRAQGAARKHMFASIGNGVGGDETKIVREMSIPLAIIGGQNDPGINYEYIAELRYGNLWRNQVHLVPNAGHAVYWERADEFNGLMAEFLVDIGL